jgi:hypothetical protein
VRKTCHPSQILIPVITLETVKKSVNMGVFVNTSKRSEANRKALERAFEYADDYVLENTSCPTLGHISKGWCDVWANAVKRKAQFVEVRQAHGHWFVVYDGAAYDSDTSDEGFEPPE